ncbi:MAG: YicC/YloC family endoribonuclease [Flavobacteriaceae bacterium]|nr:YicC/YloC family endoribonuclease [Flavobacteriaceae bacterium]
MIQSMTGYGKTVVQLPQKKVTIELKSLNSKNLDLNVRIPIIYKEKELDIRKLLSKELVRGKIEFSIYIEVTGEETTTKINKEIVNSYIDQLREIAVTSPENTLEIAMRLPDSLKMEREELDEEEWKSISKGIQDAIFELVNYRKDEGKALEDDFKERVKSIQQLSERVMDLDEERLSYVREKLKKAVDELKEDIDQNRFEQELIYYLEKLDITEEKVRLKNHLQYFLETLNSTTSNGKKLGFISQEIGREINTTGSKSNYAPMQKIVVQMKDELEKIKEQLLNVL